MPYDFVKKVIADSFILFRTCLETGEVPSFQVLDEFAEQKTADCMDLILNIMGLLAEEGSKSKKALRI